MRLKAVFFDFDGTLTDRTRSSIEGYRRLLPLLFPYLDPSSLEFESRLQSCLLMDEYGTADKTEVMNRIRKKWNGSFDAEKASALWYENFPEVQYWTKGMRETILELKKTVFTGMITNGPHDRQWPKIHALKADELLNPVLVSGDIGIRKPDPAIYEKGAQMLGLTPPECLYVGDTFATDIAGALRAGMHAAWFCGEHEGITSWKDVTVIHHPQELIHLIQG